MRSSSIFTIVIVSYFFNFSLAAATQQKSDVMGESQQKGNVSEIDISMGNSSMVGGLLNSLLGDGGARNQSDSTNGTEEQRSKKKGGKKSGGLLDKLLGDSSVDHKKAGKENDDGITNGLLGRRVRTYKSGKKAD